MKQLNKQAKQSQQAKQAQLGGAQAARAQRKCGRAQNGRQDQTGTLRQTHDKSAKSQRAGKQAQTHENVQWALAKGTSTRENVQHKRSDGSSAGSSAAREAAARLAARLDGVDNEAAGKKSAAPRNAKRVSGKAGVGHARAAEATKKRAQTDGASNGPASSGGIRHAAKAAGKKNARSPHVEKPACVKGASPAFGKAARLQAASDGAASPCTVDALCGGCANIAVPYERQLAAKQEAMCALFTQVKGTFDMLPIKGMADPFHYRNKIVSPFAPGPRIPEAKLSRAGSPDAAGKGKRRTRGLDYEILTGMYVQGTHELVPTQECLIENPVGKQVVAAVRGLMAKRGIEPYDEDAAEGFMRHVVVRVGHESGEVLVTLVTNERTFPGAKSFAREIVARVPAVTTVVQNVNTRQTNVILGEEDHVLYGSGFILDTLCGLSFRISPTSFYQVNAVQTEVLYETAIGFAQLTGAETAIDAYCGTGTIGLVAAARGAVRVIGVESVEAAVRDARENARHNGIANAEFVAADATAFMHELAHERAALPGEFVAPVRSSQMDAGVSADDQLVIFMDPPRAGSTPEFLQAAAALAPARIVYVSCNPETQVRDIVQLQQYGYELRMVQPVDMFPHTRHVETVALLARTK